ncbi:hypothetical protein [Miniphocaeibacter massiliensis]|uniref:hypothetical protein n=1 Tax=Miniphocaeibacter massiliensis TaxID=2041841 RepID=UPI000C06A052|nr:hypothetical protein [Miniphocaeibacter massiliensis]
MKKIYLKYPYLKEFNSNIVSRKLIDGKPHILCDKTIFIPRNRDCEYNDFGTINGIKVLDVYTKNNEIYHVIENNPEASKLKMKIDWNNRYEFMQKNTATYILSSYLETLYSIKITNSNLLENYIDIPLQKNLSEFKLKLDNVFNLANNIVDSSLDIFNKIEISKNKKHEYSNIFISNLKKTKHNYPFISNTAELKFVLLINIINIDNFTRIYFNTGTKALNYIKDIYADANIIAHKNNISIDYFNEFINDNLQKLDIVTNEKNIFEGRLIESLAKVVNLSNDNIIEITDDLNLYDISRYIIKDNYTIYKKYSNKIIFLSKNSKVDLKKFFENLKVPIIGTGSSLVYRGEIDKENFEVFYRKLNELKTHVNYS